jgi:hypothetical protein
MSNENPHYVCAGTCGGVSDHAQNCEAESCNFFNEPLHECYCEDGLHRESIPDAEMANA